jgi:hypothetical protein
MGIVHPDPTWSSGHARISHNSKEVRIMAMTVNDYCGSVSVELAAWKAKLYDLGRRFDRMGTVERGKVLPQILDLHAIVEDIEGRIERLKTECPLEWKPEKAEIEQKVHNLKRAYEDNWQFVVAGDIGG